MYVQQQYQQYQQQQQLQHIDPLIPSSLPSPSSVIGGNSKRGALASPTPSPIARVITFLLVAVVVSAILGWFMFYIQSKYQQYKAERVERVHHHHQYSDFIMLPSMDAEDVPHSRPLMPPPPQPPPPQPTYQRVMPPYYNSFTALSYPTRVSK
ncbi:hypothetical protein GQ42DRAFT_169387 [Ramicandelaber brevisporus]|nr:hypothetical protein GQ42DRAFT_169387 [Ramicandelaber brevisporus]